MANQDKNFTIARGNLAHSQSLLDRLSQQNMAQQSQDEPQNMAQEEVMDSPQQEMEQPEVMEVPQEQPGMLDGFAAKLQEGFESIKELFMSSEKKRDLQIKKQAKELAEVKSSIDQIVEG